jgi:hypothetical protein
MSLAYSPAVHDAAYHPPSAGEQLYADDKGNCHCLCHVNLFPPCDFCCVLTEVEAGIFAARGIIALHIHWDQVAKLRKEREQT